MAFYCATMLAMALELSRYDPAAEDIASKFFEHFVYIADAMNTIGGTGLWDEEDGFYYDQMYVDGRRIPLRVRSMVGLIPLFTVQVLSDELIGGLPGFQKRLDWFLTYRRDLAKHISYMETVDENASRGRHLLAIPSRERLERVLRYVLDENEFLSPYGVRSLVEIPPGQSLRLPLPRSGVPGGVRSRRIEHEPLRRQLELARPDLVPGELPAHRGPGAVSLLLRRQPAGRVSDRLGPVDEPGRGGAGTVSRLVKLFLPDRRSGVRTKGTRRRSGRSRLRRPPALSRVFSRGDGGRARGQPPDRLDESGRRLPVEDHSWEDESVAWDISPTTAVPKDRAACLLHPESGEGDTACSPFKAETEVGEVGESDA